MMTSYIDFADVYDILTTNIDYKEHAKYYDNLIKSFGGEKGILLDLACGTGNLSEEMSRLDYDVIGVDLSQEMLSIAFNKKFENNLPIQYVCQDMCELDMYGAVDATICALDSLNHLSNINSVKRAIERVSVFSNPNALFIFDVNTPYKHEYILSNNTFVYDTENVYCVWENNFKKHDNSVQIDLTFFKKQGNVYSRYEESFMEKAYPIKILDEILINAGFEILAHYDYMTTNEVHDKSEKITFVVRKVR